MLFGSRLFSGRNKRIDILVGVNYYYLCIGSDIEIGGGNQPLAISSILVEFYVVVMKLKEMFTQI